MQIYQKDLDVQKIKTVILKAFLQTGFLYHKLKTDFSEISRSNFCWISLNKFLQIMKDLNFFDLLVNPNIFTQNKKSFIYLLNKYIFDEFPQNSLIESNEDANLSSIEESVSRIDENSKEDEDSKESNSDSEPNSKLSPSDHFQFLNNGNGDKSLSLLKENSLEKSVNFEHKNEKSVNFDQITEEKSVKEIKSATLDQRKRKKSGKNEGYMVNQKKRSNLLLFPTQNMNLAIEKAENKDIMKQSFPIEKIEADLEEFMTKMEENCKIKLNRDNVLQIPLEILREFHRTMVDKFDKNKEAVVKSTFDMRNNLLFYNKATFSEEIEEEESESDTSEKNYFVLLSNKNKPQIFKVNLHLNFFIFMDFSCFFPFFSFFPFFHFFP